MKISKCKSDHWPHCEDCYWGIFPSLPSFFFFFFFLSDDAFLLFRSSLTSISLAICSLLIPLVSWKNQVRSHLCRCGTLHGHHEKWNVTGSRNEIQMVGFQRKWHIDEIIIWKKNKQFSLHGDWYSGHEGSTQQSYVSPISIGFFPLSSHSFNIYYGKQWLHVPFTSGNLDRFDLSKRYCSVLTVEREQWEMSIKC